MRKIFSILLTLCLLLTAGITYAAGTNISDGRVIASGVGARPEERLRPIQLKLAAKREAVKNAQIALTEALIGVSIDADNTIGSAFAGNEVIINRLKMLVKNAEIIDEHELPEGLYEVTLSIPVFGIANSVAQTVLPPNANPEAFATVQTYSNGEGCYTGVIIDCTGLELGTALRPAIITEGGERLYGYRNLHDQLVLKKGVVAYASPAFASNRAGSKPLRLQAVAVYGGICPVLSAADSERLLAENQLTHFLEYGNVVFLR